MKWEFQIIEQHCSEVSICLIYQNFSARTGQKSEHTTSCISKKLGMNYRSSLNKGKITHFCKVSFKDFGK